VGDVSHTSAFWISGRLARGAPAAARACRLSQKRNRQRRRLLQPKARHRLFSISFTHQGPPSPAGERGLVKAEPNQEAGPRGLSTLLLLLPAVLPALAASHVLPPSFLEPAALPTDPARALVHILPTRRTVWRGELPDLSLFSGGHSITLT